MTFFPKILSTQQTREADAFTIKTEPISSIDLMERASTAFIDEFVESVSNTQRIVVVCGTGNNGGDGLAIARMLKDNGFNVQAYLIKFSTSLSPDCKANFDRVDTSLILNESDIPDFSDFDVIIDALLGTGLKKPAGDLLKQVIETINLSKRTVFSVDLPSGVFCDRIEESITAIESNLVISFQCPKMAFFMPEYGEFIKKWKLVDIGLDENFIQSKDSKNFVLDNSVMQLLKPRKRFSHKGTYGHSLIISGSYGKIGAAVLSSKACLRSGAGLVTVHTPKCGYEILQNSVPEAMCTVDENAEIWTSKIDLSDYGAIGIGPGIGKHDLTLNAFHQLLVKIEIPLVIDADGINLLAENKELISLIPKNSILTPHIKEFDRLVGKSKNSQERWNKQIEFAATNELIVILKDAHTSIADTTGNLFFNTTGNPGMSTAGSGDVLTGIITGLLAQNYSQIESALIGVYFHGLAGDKAGKNLGEMSVIASDIIEYLSFKHP